MTIEILFFASLIFPVRRLHSYFGAKKQFIDVWMDFFGNYAKRATGEDHGIMARGKRRSMGLAKARLPTYRRSSDEDSGRGFRKEEEYCLLVSYGNQ